MFKRLAGMKKKGLFLLVLLILLNFFHPLKGITKEINVIKVEGIINPVIAEFISNNIKRATRERVEVLIIILDTPGGLDLSMRSIVKDIMNSEIPVVVYVYPAGARAASAGVMITIASHVAAMAQGTNIGAAHPVTLGQKMDKDMAEKVLNDASAYVHSIAQKRKRNASWAMDAVRKSSSATADEALKLGIIDLVTPDIDTLISKLDGFKVETVKGKEVLVTKGAKIEYIEMNLRDKILYTISDPNVAYLLMMIGFAGLYFEFATPGAIVPGVIGGISLILSFYAFQTLPVNYAGVLLILFAVILFLIEIKVVSHGILAGGGIISLIFGSLMLFKSPQPYLRVSLFTIIGTVTVITLFFLVVGYLAIKAFKRKPATGKESLLGNKGTVVVRLAPQDRQGKIFVHGELWNAYSDETIEKGEAVLVIGINDLSLKVEKG